MANTFSQIYLHIFLPLQGVLHLQIITKQRALVKNFISSEAAKNYGGKSKVKLCLVFEKLLLIIHILQY